MINLVTFCHVQMYYLIIDYILSKFISITWASPLNSELYIQLPTLHLHEDIW